MTRTSYPSDLSDAPWSIIAPLIPPAEPGGRRRSVDMREVIDGILYLNRTGCSWRQLPHDLPPWGTVQLMFIHLGSRKVFVSPSTYHPTGEWVQQQARNVTMWLEDENLALRFLIHDRDTKFTQAFDEHFRSVGEQIIKTPFQAPIANCFAESWIGSLKRECLNHFFCFSLRHMDHIVQIYVDYYNRLRPHQGNDNRPLTMSHDPIPIRATESPLPTVEVGPVQRQALLGGLLSHYERKAA